MGADILERADFFRLDANRRLQTSRNADWGQFLTPAPVARLLAELLEGKQKDVRILDAGAGVGSLTAAAVTALCQRAKKPQSLHVSAFEIDEHLTAYLTNTLALCRAECEAAGIKFTSEVVEGDFLLAAADRLDEGLFGEVALPFTTAILNPPYRKINARSESRRLLSRMGIETTNIYTGFLAVTARMLGAGGELVAITPRSFCNGSYFRPFRESFLSQMALRTLHVFESRQQAFQEDEVLQGERDPARSQRKRPGKGDDRLQRGAGRRAAAFPSSRLCRRGAAGRQAILHSHLRRRDRRPGQWSARRVREARLPTWG